MLGISTSKKKRLAPHWIALQSPAFFGWDGKELVSRAKLTQNPDADAATFIDLFLQAYP